jgi:prevent-host-death family protein
MEERRITSVGAYEARTRFAELLERVEQGDEITITRHGAPVARMVPIRKASTVEDRRAAVQAMRQLASRNRLDGLKVKDLIAEGRR